MINTYDFTQGPVSQRAQYLSILGSIVLLTFISYLVRKGYQKSGYSILWFFIVGIIFILTVFTDILFWFSQTTGIYYAPIAIFSVLIVGLILIAIHFSVVLSRHERRIKKLAQENALLSNKIKALKNKN